MAPGHTVSTNSEAMETMTQQAPMVPAGSQRAELEVKMSRFIAHAERVTTREAAMAAVERLRGEFPDARHHCWAYFVGNPAGAASAAMSDDGEPSGTAGKPILNVIQHKGLGDILVVVVRYFGGVKLGAGGLVRAYAGVTERVLAALPVERHVPRSTVVIRMDFAHEQAVRHWVETHDAAIENVDYGDGVTICLTVAEALTDDLESFCAANAMTLQYR